MASNGFCRSEFFLLAAQIIRGRWFMVFATTLIMSSAGATYAFGIYSKDIKLSLGYDQKTLNTLSFFKDFGANVGILSGLIAEITPTWVVLGIGAAMNLTGYLMMWLAVTGRIARPQLWHMCLYIFVGANSQSFANTGALVTCVKNFPESRGIMLGLQKGYVGLSSAIFTQLYHAIYGEDSKSLILFIGWLPATVSVIFVYTIRVMKVVRRVNEMRVFYHLLYIAVGLAAYIMVVIIAQRNVIFSRAGYIGSAIAVVIMLLLPLTIVVREELTIWRLPKQSIIPTPITICIDKIEKLKADPISSSSSSSAASNSISSSSVSTQQRKQYGFSRFIKTFKAPNRGEDYTIPQALVSADMWILLITLIFGISGTLTAIDNMGQIGESLGYPTRSIGTFVSLISIWNFVGRVAAGFSSDIFLMKYTFPRPLMLTIVVSTSCIGHFLIASGLPGSIYITSVIIGFCFGAMWPLFFAIISELFGLKYYSTLYNFGSASSPIGSYILNVRVAGVLYDKEASKQIVAQTGDHLTCIGVQCFRLPFNIIGATTLGGALFSIALVLRTWKFYKGDIYERYQAAKVMGENEMSVAGNYDADGARIKEKSSPKTNDDVNEHN